MTRRERLERKIERRREWADKAAARADSQVKQAHDMASIIPFGQPILVGHHSEKRDRAYRGRIEGKFRKGFENLELSKHHDSKADGLETQLDRAIFSDDDNAIEALQARIAEHETEREKMKTVNKLYKKGDVEGLRAIGLDYEAIKQKLASLGSYFGQAPHMPYELSNLGGRISTDRKRLDYLKQQRARSAKAEESPNGVTLEQCQGGYVRVTFAEKPDREILNALRGAGFHWGGGSWAGKADQLPESVKSLIQTPAADPEPVVIKGAPGGEGGRWAEVQAVQDQPFIFIMSNGSHWAGDEEDDIAQLAETLQTETLDPSFGSFYSPDVCAGVEDPQHPGQFIDGDRLYHADGVFRFFGNFLTVSHVFNIDTNHKPTIELLKRLIDANMQREEYRNEVKTRTAAARELVEMQRNKQDPFWMVDERPSA